MQQKNLMRENTRSFRILEDLMFTGRKIGATPFTSAQTRVMETFSGQSCTVYGDEGVLPERATSGIHRWRSQSLPFRLTFPVDSVAGSFRVKPLLRKIPGRSAFTLIELLVVIAILGLLAALIAPSISRGLTSARLMKSISNVRQIHTGFLLYIQDHNGVFPSSDFWDSEWWMAPLNGVPEYLYPGRDLTYDKRGTVFESPNVESDGAFGAGRRTISYGLNGSLIAGMPSRRYLLFDQPHNILLLADASFSHDLWGRINYRNDGRAVCLFLSGQVLTLTQEDVATFDQRMFWQGRR